MEEPEEGGATEIGINQDYVEDITTAQGTWDPWPTSAQDAPTPPQDDPAPAQEDCDRT